MSAAAAGRRSSGTVRRWRRFARLAGSTTVRFVAVIGAVFALAFVALSLLVWTTASAYMERRVADTIATDIAGLEDLWREGGTAALGRAVERRRGENPARIHIVVTAEGDKVAGDFDAWPNTAVPESGNVRFADPTGRRHFTGELRRIADGPVLLVAHDRAEHEALMAALARDLAVPFAIAFLVALATTVIVGRRLLARIEAVNAVARAVEAGDLAARAPGAELGDEFGRLATHVNRMLERIAALVKGVHHLSDQIAHETRTPLARLRARLERARREAEVDPASRGAVPAFDDAIAESVELISVFAALLDIARTEAAAGDARGLGDVDLAAAVATVVDLYEAVAEERAVGLDVAVVPAVVLGEAMLITRMLANIVDNAVKFSPSGGVIDIRLEATGDGFRLWVRDRGPGLPAGFEASAFERFTRAANVEAVPGHGLGLPLVRAVALRHGMKIDLEPADPGLRVVVTIRAARP